MESRSLQVSWIVLTVALVPAMLSGILLAVAPTVFIAGEFAAFTGGSLGEFAEAQPAAYAFLLLEDSELGVFLFGLLLLTLLITVIPYRKGERWAWYAVLASLILSAIGSVGLNIPTGDLGVVILTGSIHLVGLVGLAIGARPHLRK